MTAAAGFSLDEMVRRDYRDRDGQRFESWNQYLEYCKAFGKRVMRTKIGDADVSTVWLGLDHSFRGGPPLIFETMIFGGEHDLWCTRYTTEEDAVRGHLRLIERLRAGLSPDDYEDES